MKTMTVTTTTTVTLDGTDAAPVSRMVLGTGFAAPDAALLYLVSADTLDNGGYPECDEGAYILPGTFNAMAAGAPVDAYYHAACANKSDHGPTPTNVLVVGTATMLGRREVLKVASLYRGLDVPQDPCDRVYVALRRTSPKAGHVQVKLSQSGSVLVIDPA